MIKMNYILDKQQFFDFLKGITNPGLKKRNMLDKINIPKLNKTRKYDYEMDSVSLDTISEYDLVILATDHDDYDYDMLLSKVSLIVDTRGRFNNTHEKVIKA